MRENNFTCTQWLNNEGMDDSIMVNEVLSVSKVMCYCSTVRCVDWGHCLWKLLQNRLRSHSSDRRCSFERLHRIPFSSRGCWWVSAAPSCDTRRDRGGADRNDVVLLEWRERKEWHWQTPDLNLQYPAQGKKNTIVEIESLTEWFSWLNDWLNARLFSFDVRSKQQMW